MPLKIAIIGAGPAGCMLARLLLHHNATDISVRIFEGESALEFRSQGGTLDLHEKDGQRAIREAGLWEEFRKHVRYDGEAMKIADKNFVCYVSMAGVSEPKTGSLTTGRPEIDRLVLREMLYRSLPEGVVRWDKKLTSVERTGKGLELNLRFADGTVETGFDLIVGADGAWSKVRNLVSDVKPYYSGIAGHYMSIQDARNRKPELYDAVNRGSLFSYGDGKGMFAQYQGDGSINIGTWSVHSEDWKTESGYDVNDAKAVKAAYAKQYADWHPTLQAFLQEADDQVGPRDLYMLPVGNTWEHMPGVTLIGDAAHLMTPFAGEGVNLAFMDCLKLSKAILSAASTSEDSVTTQLDTNVAAFEQDMFVRAKRTQQQTLDMMNAVFFTPGAPRYGIEAYILAAMKDEMGWLLTKVLTPIVYAYFFVFKLTW